MSTKTKSFDSTMPAAPVLSGTAGTLIALLDAVLVNGFGLQTATSVTIAAGVATVNVATTPSAVVDSVVLIAGATPAGLNGEQRVTAIAPNSVSFATAETGAVTGTVTMKVAPAGWSKAFSGTNLAAYKIIDPTGTGSYLRVDDTGATSARVLGYESMTGVSTGQGPFPAAAQWASPGLWWSKSGTADTTACEWRVFADAAGVYFYPLPNAGHQAHTGYFGDLISLRSNDPYRCCLRGYPSNSASYGEANGSEVSYNDSAMQFSGFYVARAANAVGSAAQHWGAQTVNVAGAVGQYGIGSVGVAYPSLTDNGLMFTRVMAFTATTIRGYLPGLYGTPQNVVSAFNMGDRVPGSGDMAGKTVTAVKTGSGAGQACVFMDSVSDWR